MASVSERIKNCARFLPTCNNQQRAIAKELNACADELAAPRAELPADAELEAIAAEMETTLTPAFGPLQERWASTIRSASRRLMARVGELEREIAAFERNLL